MTGAPTTPVDVSIGRPDFAPGLDTDRIAVLKGRQLDYFRGVRWGGRTVEVVQSMLVATMNDQQLFRSVTAEQARVANDYMLDVEVRNFEADYAGGAIPEVHVMIIGRLIRVVDRKLVSTVTQRIASACDRGEHDCRRGGVRIGISKSGPGPGETNSGGCCRRSADAAQSAR